MPRRIRFVLLALSLGVLGISGITNAAAYGTEHLFQITFSENCVNPTLCVQNASNPFGIGGIWGWVEPDAGGSADAQVTFQGHSNTNPALNGTVHLPSNWAWTIVTITPPPSPFISPTDPHNQYFLLTIPSFPGFEFLTPATPGKYGGTLAPGINANVTVTAMN